MTFYPARDWMEISAMPGCAEGHSRPRDPHTGRPVPKWAVDCAAHEAYYKGAGKPKVLTYVKDRKTGAILRQDRVPDLHPGVGFTPGTIPLTRDEEETQALRLEQGENQLRALESIATLAKAGIDIRHRPDVLLYLRENNLPEDVLQGSVLCVNDHPNPAGVKFCNECGASMTARGAIGGGGETPAPSAAADLASLHPQKLKKLCRERGLPDAGSKNELIARLAA